MAATFTHLLLWNYADIRLAWDWLAPSRLRASLHTFRTRGGWRALFKSDSEEERMRKYEEAKGNKELDPHYREMLKYQDAPNSWYAVTLVLSSIISLVVIYKANSTLPWWGFLISVAIGSLSTLFFGALYAITGLQFVSAGIEKKKKKLGAEGGC